LFGIIKETFEISKEKFIWNLNLKNIMGGITDEELISGIMGQIMVSGTFFYYYCVKNGTWHGFHRFYHQVLTYV
jgi:hypothetical protein